MRLVSRGRSKAARAGVVLTVALALVAACQPPPRPFAPSERGGGVPFSPAEDAYGITLRPVSGMPSAVAGAFISALVEALARREVPAALSSERARGSLAYGAAEARALDSGRLEIAIEWWVIGRDGRGLGRHWVSAKPQRRDWEHASQPLVRRLADESADGIVALLRRSVPGREGGPPAVRVGTVVAPPGIDGDILRRSMTGAMREARFGVSPHGQDGPRLTAKVSLGPVSGGMRRLRVEWRLEDASGARIGAIVQENDVVDETLIADWPAIVRLIARAATDELGGLLERARGVASTRPVDGLPRRP